VQAAINQKPRMIMLDGLRGIAAITVMIFHYHMLTGSADLFSSCYLAVDFFFLLSGFVMAEVVESFDRTAADTWHFVVGRIRRVWPAMAVGSLIGAGLYVLLGELPTFYALPFLFFALISMPMLAGGNTAVFPLNVPQWSLLIELVANVFHISVFCEMSTRALSAVALIGWLGAAYLTQGLHSLDTGSVSGTLACGFMRAAFAYPLGVVLSRSRRHFGGTHARWWLSPGLLLAGLLGPGLLQISYKGAIDLLIVATVFPAALIVAVATEVPAYLASIMKKSGGLSFPLYAIHYPILDAGIQLSLRAPVNLRPAIIIGTFALISAATWILVLIGVGTGRRQRAYRTPSPITVSQVSAVSGSGA
jgi:peptidoglycan/LPS O-acetylase OafA/YrhL